MKAFLFSCVLLCSCGTDFVEEYNSKMINCLYNDANGDSGIGGKCDCVCGQNGVVCVEDDAVMHAVIVRTPDDQEKQDIDDAKKEQGLMKLHKRVK